MTYRILVVGGLYGEDTGGEWIRNVLRLGFAGNTVGNKDVICIYWIWFICIRRNPNGASLVLSLITFINFTCFCYSLSM